MKTFGEGEKFFVVNHETNTIYNDVVEFDKSRLDQAIKSYNSFPKADATLLVRGVDGQFLMKKGDDQFIG